ncbi:MAG: hypothetical protein Q7V17_12620 [Afipia sp.]|nr:hypothetical protein [Afipia sp.]
MHEFTYDDFDLPCSCRRESRNKKMPRQYRPFPGLVLMLLLAMVIHQHGLFTARAWSASTEYLRIAQADKAVSDPHRLIRGERINCLLPAATAEALDPATTAALAGAKKFQAGEHFKENAASSANVRIVWLGATFMRRFAIKIEDASGETALQSHTLLRPSLDRHIIDDLDDGHETRLVDLWCLLNIQANGESGILLVDAVPNIFYVRDSAGVLGAVDAVWGGAGWEIGASPINDARMWPVRARVMSR